MKKTIVLFLIGCVLVAIMLSVFAGNDDCLYASYKMLTDTTGIDKYGSRTQKDIPEI